MYENTKHVKLSTILFFIQDCKMLVKLIRFNFQNLKEEKYFNSREVSPDIVYSFKNSLITHV